MPESSVLPYPWKNAATTKDSSFCQMFTSEFRPSAIEGGGLGWWATVDMPAGVRLRRVSIEDGSLLRFANESELKNAGWEMKDCVHYGIGHKTDKDALYYLNPGTPCNHADPNVEVAVEYRMTKAGEMELWTARDIKAGEELVIDYCEDYVECKWYDKMMMDQGLTPLTKLGPIINEMYAKPKPWNNPACTDADSFNSEHSTEFRASAIEGAGLGWWAKADIPAGAQLRRVAVEDGSLIRVADKRQLRAAGWHITEAVHYGIGHKADRGAIYFLNPGTPANHADPSRRASIEYRMVKPGEMELWSLTDIKAGEEMFIDYTETFVKCEWYDELCKDHAVTPLSKIGHDINGTIA